MVSLSSSFFHPALGPQGEPSALAGSSLRTLFLDLLGRPPFREERERWSGRDRAELIDSTLSGEDFWRNWLEEQLYYFMLIDNFRPATEGVQTLPPELAAGKIGLREALHRICLSTSFDRRNPGPDTFVTVVMEQLLGMTVQKSARELEIGKKLYDGSAGSFLGQAGRSQADVVHIAIADGRCLPHLLRREYERLLRQEPEEGKLAAWTSLLEKDDKALGSILREWFSSDAYQRRLAKRVPEPNRVFARSLFVDLMGRLPSDDEAQRIRSALDGLADSGPLRSIIARMLLDSGKAAVPERAAIADPGAWISELFERMLGRSPDPEEQATFLACFQDPACRPATVVYAIVSHPEYQTW